MKNERDVEIDEVRYKIPVEDIMYCWWCGSDEVTIEYENSSYQCNDCGLGGWICACCGEPLHGQVVPRWLMKESGEKLFYCTKTCGERLISEYGESIKFEAQKPE